MLNFSKGSVSYDVPAEVDCSRALLETIGNYHQGGVPDISGGKVELRPYEAFVVAFRV